VNTLFVIHRGSHQGLVREAPVNKSREIEQYEPVTSTGDSSRLFRLNIPGAVSWPH
jgi:hypothetical protein